MALLCIAFELFALHWIALVCIGLHCIGLNSIALHWLELDCYARMKERGTGASEYASLLKLFFGVFALPILNRNGYTIWITRSPVRTEQVNLYTEDTPASVQRQIGTRGRPVRAVGATTGDGTPSSGDGTPSSPPCHSKTPWPSAAKVLAESLSAAKVLADRLPAAKMFAETLSAAKTLADAKMQRC